MILNPLTLSCRRVPLVLDKVNLPPTLLTTAWKYLPIVKAPNLVMWWETRGCVSVIWIGAVNGLSTVVRETAQFACKICYSCLRSRPTKSKAFISPASSADRTSIIRSNREHHFLRGSPTQSNNLTIYLRYSLFDRDSSMLLSDSDSSRCQRLEASDSVWMWVVHGSCWRGSSAHKFGCQVCEYGCLMSWITRTWNLLSSSAIIASTINWFSFSFYVENCGGRY